MLLHEQSSTDEFKQNLVCHQINQKMPISRLIFPLSHVKQAHLKTRITIAKRKQYVQINKSPPKEEITITLVLQKSSFNKKKFTQFPRKLCTRKSQILETSILRLDQQFLQLTQTPLILINRVSFISRQPKCGNSKQRSWLNNSYCMLNQNTIDNKVRYQDASETSKSIFFPKKSLYQPSTKSLEQHISTQKETFLMVYFLRNQKLYLPNDKTPIKAYSYPRKHSTNQPQTLKQHTSSQMGTFLIVYSSRSQKLYLVNDKPPIAQAIT